MEIEVVPVNSAPVIDGGLDDPVWEKASRVEGFIQIRPIFGETSPMSTEVLVIHDQEALYVAFRCADGDPAAIAAAVTARDGDLESDDVVAVMLDPFRSGHAGYYFGANLLGTQFDGRLADNGRTVDDKWDATWQGAAALTETGWSIELAIPFRILRYGSGDDQTWGINFLRTVPRRLEASVWSGPGESEWRVSEFGALSGVNAPSGGAKWWEIIPYILGWVESGNDGDVEVGGDFRFRVRNRVSAELTFNPDFALIEADLERLNLTRFELLVPDKRPFFMEGAERFNQRIQQFYSRRIGDIDWGAKSTATAGRLDIIALGTRSEVDVETPDPEVLERDDAGYGVIRLQQGILSSSNVGLLAANRRLGGEDAGSVGVDTTLFFTERVGLTGQYLHSYGPEGSDGKAWFVRPAYDSANLHFHVRYTNLDEGILENFNTVGFLRDDNRKEFDTNVTRTFWFEDSTVEKLEAGINYNRYRGQDGALRSYLTDLDVSLAFTSRWNLFASYEDEFVTFDKGYWNTLTTLGGGYDNRAGRAFEVVVATGRNFDDDLWLYSAALAYRISEAWSLSGELTRLDLEPDLDGRSTWIQLLRSTYYFTPDLYAKLLYQTNTSIDKETVQVVTVWRFLPPFGQLQVAYQRGTSPLGETSEQGDTLFTKLAWVF
jgi:hypothetical protein